jgi:hypothetical protein
MTAESGLRPQAQVDGRRGARMLARGKNRHAGEASSDNGKQQTAGASKPSPPLCYKRNPFSDK